MKIGKRLAPFLPLTTFLTLNPCSPCFYAWFPIPNDIPPSLNGCIVVLEHVQLNRRHLSPLPKRKMLLVMAIKSEIRVALSHISIGSSCYLYRNERAYNEGNRMLAVEDDEHA